MEEVLPRRKPGDRASGTTVPREHPLGSITACSAKRVWRIPYFIDVNGPVLNSVPAQSKQPTSPHPRLYVSAVGIFPKTNYHWTDHASRAREVDFFQVLYMHKADTPCPSRKQGNESTSTATIFPRGNAYG